MSIQSHRIRVRYAETDQMAVAHHGAYVAWLEEARIAWLRSNGLSYRDIEAGGTLLPVIDLSLKYRKAARFDDVLECATDARLAGPSRVTFTTTISRSGEVIAEGAVTVAAVDREGKPVRIPRELVPLFA